MTIYKLKFESLGVSEWDRSINFQTKQFYSYPESSEEILTRILLADEGIKRVAFLVIQSTLYVHFSTPLISEGIVRLAGFPCTTVLKGRGCQLAVHHTNIMCTLTFFMNIIMSAHLNDMGRKKNLQGFDLLFAEYQRLLHDVCLEVTSVLPLPFGYGLVEGESEPPMLHGRCSDKGVYVQ